MESAAVASSAQHKLNLRVKFRDIVILKIREPKTPGPLISVSNPEAYEKGRS